MVHIPLPADLCQKVADKAVAHARQDMQGRGWKSARGLTPMSHEGMVGIKTTAKYVMFQERGTKPFLMKWVEGRTIPMGCSQGDGPHFRRGANVGTPGYVNIPHRGRVWRNQRWHHPGIKANRFMQTALTKAIGEIRIDLKQEIMRALRGEYH